MNTFTQSNRALDFLFADKRQPFALLYRPDTLGNNHVDVLRGDVSFVDALTDITLNPLDGNKLHDKLVILPYKQLSERGFDATDDGAPLVSMSITEQSICSIAEVMEAIKDQKIDLSNEKFSMDDDEYAAMVSDVLKNEIGQGKGASFVLQRSFTAEIKGDSVESALNIFKKLITKQAGSYWVFVINTGERVLVGATPERHITLDSGVAVMNPISGTYRYPATGPKLAEITQFLADKKEADELYMVVDEELKMMTRVCDSNVVVKGPMLKEMAHLAHTEYFIEGKSSMDPLSILKETMFAPSVTGSPQESAARVINQYEPDGRGYYSGVVALIGQDEGKRTLDSSILIRTADINNRGHLRLAVGATLVRGSDPLLEAEETKAKASGLLVALGINTVKDFSRHPEVLRLLAARNHSIADFWLNNRQSEFSLGGPLAGKKILIIDEEDTFSSMIKHQLHSLHCDVVVRRFDEDYSFDDGYDLVVMGPGPGDPNDLGNAKIVRLYSAISNLLERQQPFLAVCLSHQVLSATLGLTITRRSDPNQGVQKDIDLFGHPECVGFYNTFSARCVYSHISIPGRLDTAEVSFDPDEGEVHALRGNGFYGIQFHPESILTIDGVRIFEEILTRLSDENDKKQPLLNAEKVA